MLYSKIQRVQIHLAALHYCIEREVFGWYVAIVVCGIYSGTLSFKLGIKYLKKVMVAVCVCLFFSVC